MIFTWANAITAFRLMLLAWFIALVHTEQFQLAALVFFLAWGLDAVDGFVARTFHQATETGSFFDKSVDRLILVSGALAALAYGMIPAIAVVLFAKEWLSLLLILQRRHGHQVFNFGIPGKVVTLLEGSGLIWLMLRWPYGNEVVIGVAIVGTIVGVRQIVKVMRAEKK